MYAEVIASQRCDVETWFILENDAV